ncbi:MAG TPA: hypothetical protein VI953_02705 [Candidatus Paceibacterota bacterium]
MRTKKLVHLYCSGQGCDKPATWARFTQYSGKHPFCDVCAKKEIDFNKETDNLYWEKIPAKRVAPIHRIEVEHYEGELELLVRRIHGMRYDKVAEFYLLTARELHKQAEGDEAKGRTVLADILRGAASTTLRQHQMFKGVWRLCKPHIGKPKKS